MRKPRDPDDARTESCGGTDGHVTLPAGKPAVAHYLDFLFSAVAQRFGTWPLSLAQRSQNSTQNTEEIRQAAVQLAQNSRAHLFKKIIIIIINFADN